MHERSGAPVTQPFEELPVLERVLAQVQFRVARAGWTDPPGGAFYPASAVVGLCNVLASPGLPGPPRDLDHLDAMVIDTLLETDPRLGPVQLRHRERAVFREFAGALQLIAYRGDEAAAGEVEEAAYLRDLCLTWLLGYSCERLATREPVHPWLTRDDLTEIKENRELLAWLSQRTGLSRIGPTLFVVIPDLVARHEAQPADEWAVTVQLRTAVTAMRFWLGA